MVRYRQFLQRQALNRTYGAGWVADLDVRPFFARKATTDFNANGSSDILWKGDAVGQFETWMMAGATLERASGFVLPTGYRIMAAGDFKRRRSRGLAAHE